MIKNLIFAILLMLALGGCGPSRDQVESKSKELLQQSINSNEGLKDLGIQVSRVDAIKESDNKYKGLATVSMDGKDHQVSINILADSERIMVNAENGAFAFAAKKLVQKTLSALPNQAGIPEGEIASIDPIDMNFRCPESFPTIEERTQAITDFTVQYAQNHPQTTLAEIASYRVSLLEKHGCTETLKNIQSAPPAQAM